MMAERANGNARSFLWIGLVSLGLLGVLPGAVGAAQEWKLNGEIFGELKRDRPVGSLDGKDYKKASDISGIACAQDRGFPRLCLIVDDEAQGTQIVRLDQDGGRAGSFIPLVSDVFRRPDGRDKAIDFDGEAVAYTEGAFYVAGSHGRPRHEARKPGADPAEQDAKAQVSRRLFRLAFLADAVNADGAITGPAPVITETGRLNDAIAAHPEISATSNAPLAEQGLSVEGIAVRGGRLYAGLRTPVSEGTAWILSVPLDVLFGDKPLTSELIGLKLGPDTKGTPRGIRDLVPFHDGFLVVAGPAVDPPDDAVADGDYTLFYSAGDRLEKLIDLPGYGTKVKPEAVLPLTEADGIVEALLLFDGPEQGAGRTIRFKAP
ncbi:DUF3616 domain-containing protein [Ancylobacter sp. VNQ12]|uniref:DUF3616 domain-containing protein n=1 Tax=Ancylobacter sp. VNQ12 TaxID=3400920 RepID=UPI003C07254C